MIKFWKFDEDLPREVPIFMDDQFSPAYIDVDASFRRSKDELIERIIAGDIRFSADPKGEIPVEVFVDPPEDDPGVVWIRLPSQPKEIYAVLGPEPNAGSPAGMWSDYVTVLAA